MTMIVSSPNDYREVARRRLPRFLFDYLDGGACAEQTLARNALDLAAVTLRQRVLKGVTRPRLDARWFDQDWSCPVALGPVGLCGMYARRGEVQAARAAAAVGIPFVLSTVSVCPLREVVKESGAPVWFQLYVLKDRGFMRDVMERARALGVTHLVFTVDMPVPGLRYRDRRSGMSGRFARPRRFKQALFHPRWAVSVGLRGRPHDLGNISTYRGRVTGLEDYIGWLARNFDPGIGWSDLEWIRDFWKGPLVIKGVLDPGDARDAVRFGADGLIVSNHGGRQLDGVPSTARALPAVADAVGDALTVFADSGVRSGLDVVRMLALGARGVFLGRAYVYALAAGGEAAVVRLLEIMKAEMEVALTLMGAGSLKEVGPDALVTV